MSTQSQNVGLVVLLLIRVYHFDILYY